VRLLYLQFYRLGIHLFFQPVFDCDGMSKRFTDTDKWKKDFLRGLDSSFKLLWVFICDDCDHAGIWHFDPEVAEIRIGSKIDWAKAKDQMASKIHVFDGGKKWFIPSFLEFQYGELNEKNRVHASVFRQLDKYNLRGLLKGLNTPLDGVKDKD
jgi:hypothetical protein